MKPKRKRCYYCGAPAQSSEHVPPKMLFPDPKPSDLITVPSCTSHNQLYTRDDEYFGLMIASFSAHNPTAKEVASRLATKKVLHGKPALLHQIMSNTVWVNCFSPGGILLTPRPEPGFRYDRERFQRVVDKIVRGLFFHEKKRPLGADYEVKDFQMFGRLREPSDDTKALISSLPLHEVGNGIFGYRVGSAEEDDNVTLWFLMFYYAMLVVTMTAPTPKSEAIGEEQSQPAQLPTPQARRAQETARD
jgi:hypothetical protein